MSVTIQCPATVTTSLTGQPQCLDGVGDVVAWVVVPDFDLSMIDTPTASEGFSAGFVVVATAWAIGKGVSLVLKSIRG
jgi:hypothetical protein